MIMKMMMTLVTKKILLSNRGVARIFQRGGGGGEGWGWVVTWSTADVRS